MIRYFSLLLFFGFNPTAHAQVGKQWIFIDAPFAQCHASTIVSSTNGLVAAWFAGTAEKNPDVGIWLSRRVNEKWTPPREVANGIEASGKRFPCWNPVLFQPREGPLLLFYKVGASPRNWWGMLLKSSDGGASWSTPQRLPKGFVGPIKNKPIQLQNGEILYPSSSENRGWRVHVERTNGFVDEWTSSRPLNDPLLISAIQPSFLVHPNNRLQMLGRTKEGRMFSIESLDNGQSWGTMSLLDIPNPNSGTDALTLRDGRHLLIYNPVSRRRTPLSIAISSDGKSWRKVLDLETEKGEFSYPAIIQSDDGLVHCTYTWNRKRIRYVVFNPTGFELATRDTKSQN